ncbi:unnamed protein product [Meganyctiphanes norvegica]|uniref:Uncharacterized protein n=1 Tax=Meganyctiphanes norvegica TaxID=48144 RepID=A0AAV2RQQ1_MEGNR
MPHSAASATGALTTNVNLIVVAAATTLLSLCVAEVCEVHRNTARQDDTGQSNITIQPGIKDTSAFDLMTCPGPLDPVNHTACCYNGYNGYVDDDAESGDGSISGQPKCCVPVELPQLYMDDQVAMIIALSVTSVAVVITIMIVICCFWSRCPLYTACRIRYHQDDIIAYASKDEEMAGLNEMPPEEKKGVTIYSPNAVKVTLKDDI